MQLRLHDANKLIDLSFGYWLLPRVSQKILHACSKYDFTKLNEYLTSGDAFKLLYNKTYSVESLMPFILKNIHCIGDEGEIFIEFKVDKFVPGFDRVSLGQLIKFINYGTLDIKGCPIFTDTFDYISKNIDQYVGIYYKL